MLVGHRAAVRSIPSDGPESEMQAMLEFAPQRVGVFQVRPSAFTRNPAEESAQVLVHVQCQPTTWNLPDGSSD